MYEYYFSGYLEVGIWAYRTAGWQFAASQTVYADGGTSSFQQQMDIPWELHVGAALGTDVQKVGVTVEYHSGIDAGIYYFNELAWQAPGSAGGVRSATPNGEKSTVVVTP